MRFGSNNSRAKWKDDHNAPECGLCGSGFTLFTRRHHCRRCGGVFCAKCCSAKVRGVAGYKDEAVLVCDECVRGEAEARSLEGRGRHVMPLRARYRRVAVVGMPGCGKSALIARYLWNTFTNTSTTQGPSPPQHADDTATSAPTHAAQAGPAAATSKVVFYKGHEYHLALSEHRVDDGLHRPPAETVGCDWCHSAHAVLLVFAIDDPASFAALPRVREEALRNGLQHWAGPDTAAGTADQVLVIVGAKADLPAAQREVPTPAAAHLARQWGVSFVEVSSKRGTTALQGQTQREVAQAADSVRSNSSPSAATDTDAGLVPTDHGGLFAPPALLPTTQTATVDTLFSYLVAEIAKKDGF